MGETEQIPHKIPINIEEKINTENHQQKTTTVIIAAGKNHPMDAKISQQKYETGYLSSFRAPPYKPPASHTEGRGCTVGTRRAPPRPAQAAQPRRPGTAARPGRATAVHRDHAQIALPWFSSPKCLTLNVIMRNHQINPNGRISYRRTH